MRLDIKKPSRPTPAAIHSQTPLTMSGHGSQASSRIQPIQKLLRQIYQDGTMEVARLDQLPASPHKGYIITTADSKYYVLKTSPSRSTRLLRYETASPAGEAHILELLSRLIVVVPAPTALSSSNASSNAVSGPYLLRSYVTGVSLSSISHSLTPVDRANYDSSIGAYFRHVITIRKDAFGTSERVLRGNGYPTWREAFHTLFEAVLRDAEDLVLTLPYESIRYYVGAHLHILDAIREPRLVPLRAGTPETVLVDQLRKAVVGVVSWGDVLWGDPALGEVFGSGSEAFWSGFGGRKILDHGDGGDDRRRMIYAVYRCLVTIVKQSSRPRQGVDESEARRLLNWSLHQLAT